MIPGMGASSELSDFIDTSHMIPHLSLCEMAVDASITVNESVWTKDSLPSFDCIIVSLNTTVPPV